MRRDGQRRAQIGAPSGAPNQATSPRLGTPTGQNHHDEDVGPSEGGGMMCSEDPPKQRSGAASKRRPEVILKAGFLGTPQGVPQVSFCHPPGTPRSTNQTNHTQLEQLKYTLPRCELDRSRSTLIHSRSHAPASDTLSLSSSILHACRVQTRAKTHSLPYSHRHSLRGTQTTHSLSSQPRDGHPLRGALSAD